MLLVFGLLSWLTSGIGKGVFESRLSSAMGRPVVLEGEFSLDLLPLPGASGSDLRIYSRDGQDLVLSAGEYLAHLALWPLLKGEVEVVALAASDAALDIGVLNAEQPPADTSGSAWSGLPAIADFSLSAARIYFNGMESEPWLRVETLELADFRLDQRGEFRMQAAMINQGEPLVALAIDGGVRLSRNGLLVVSLESMDAAYDAWRLEGLSGEVALEMAAAKLTASLAWRDAAQAVRVETDLELKPDFPDDSDGWAVERLEVGINGHVITGAGCLLRTEPLQVHLELSAPSMSLADLKSIADKWRRPGNTPAAPSAAVDELPFQPAIRLVIDQASYTDTLAEGVRINVGQKPACPETL